MDLEAFLAIHEPQLLLSGIPQHLWESLNRKLSQELMDAGDYFAMIREEDSENENEEEGDSRERRVPIWHIQATESIEHEDPNSIFLIDHAWTFRYDSARAQLMENPQLLKRMCELIGLDYSDSTLDSSLRKMSVFRIRKSSDQDMSDISPEKYANTSINGEKTRPPFERTPTEDLESLKKNLEGEDPEEMLVTKQTDAVLREMWKFAQTYSVKAPGLETEQQMPVWYIMDEFGSRIQHSEDFNVRVVPFYFAGSQMFYSVMFPVKAMQDGDEVTRDYVEISEFRKPEWRELYLLPWKNVDYAHLPAENVAMSDQFFEANREAEIMPLKVWDKLKRENQGKLKVYAEGLALVDHLSPEKCELVESEGEADVLWLKSNFKDYRNLAETNPQALINQFPNESILTVKDLLAAAVQNSYRKRSEDNLDAETSDERKPFWFPMTYNLRMELPQFVSMYQNRAKKNLDNHWIVKPWNLARGLDTYVTSDLGQIIRLIDSGPKVACKYLSEPVTFFREDINGWVKFDLRYIVLLRSVRPLEIYVYDRFWLRFALKPFSLSECDDYEKHFTVFNYLDASKILQMKCEDFVSKFHDQNPATSWNQVQNQIYSVIRETFEIASEEEPPKGLAHNPQSRAMYGLDIMLRWRNNEFGEKIMQPVLLEVNFMPDCGRACDYYPDFADTVFNVLFSDEPEKVKNVTKL